MNPQSVKRLQKAAQINFSQAITKTQREEQLWQLSQNKIISYLTVKTTTWTRSPRKKQRALREMMKRMKICPWLKGCLGVVVAVLCKEILLRED